MEIPTACQWENPKARDLVETKARGWGPTALGASDGGTDGEADGLRLGRSEGSTLGRSEGPILGNNDGPGVAERPVGLLEQSIFGFILTPLRPLPLTPLQLAPRFFIMLIIPSPRLEDALPSRNNEREEEAAAAIAC